MKVLCINDRPNKFDLGGLKKAEVYEVIDNYQHPDGDGYILKEVQSRGGLGSYRKDRFLLLSSEIQEAKLNTYYKCFIQEVYIAEAQFIDDENIGKAFVKEAITESGELTYMVYNPDKIIEIEE